MHIKSELSQLPLLYAFCEEQGIDNQSLLALEEVVVNIANYSAANYIDLTYQSESLAETFVVEDDGVMFDPTAYESPENNAEVLRIGGQGINIIRNMMSEMHYRRHDNKNFLTLIRNKQ